MDDFHGNSSTSSGDPITVAEVEISAKTRLPQNVYDFYAGGADDQEALGRNKEAFEGVRVVPRVLRDVREVETSTEIFGYKMAIPFAFAPSAMQKLAGSEGEADVAKAAMRTGLNLTLSSQSTTSLEDVMVAAKSATRTGAESPNLWFQIYLTANWERNAELISRAEVAGYKALVLTVDTPVLGNRLKERKSPVVLPPSLFLANYSASSATHATSSGRRLPSINRQLMDARTASQARRIADAAKSTLHDPSLAWNVIAKLKSMTQMKIILKGIMAADDARLAMEHGADAIIVSNHGGRQLDCAPSTLEVLPSIAAVVKGKIPVIFDGGVRKGSDIFKAIALGANLVLIGRPVLWGLGFDGQHGVEAVVHILERELSRTMALAGVTRVADIPKVQLIHQFTAKL